MSGANSSYRVLEVNTAVRHLPTAGALVKCAKGEVGLDSLLTCLFQWSNRTSEAYVQLGNDYSRFSGRVTTWKDGSHVSNSAAAMRYLSFLSDLALVTRGGNLVRRTWDGELLCALDEKDVEPAPFTVGAHTALFFLQTLLRADTDGILTVLQMVMTLGEATLNQLQRGLQRALVDRLAVKASLARTDDVARALAFKANSIQTEWRAPERYAEHIVPPRLGWLTDLGLVSVTAVGTSKTHSLTDSGRNIATLLRVGQGEDVLDVSDDWLLANSPGSLVKALLGTKADWSLLSDEERLKIMRGYVGAAVDRFTYATVGRASLRHVLEYTAVRAGVERSVAVSRQELQRWWKSNEVADDSFSYRIYEGARDTESFVLASELA